MRGNYRSWEQIQARTRDYLTLNWPHAAHTTAPEKFLDIFFTIITLNFFKIVITPLTFIFIVYYYLSKEFQKNTYFCFIDYDKAFDCGSQQTEKQNWKIKQTEKVLKRWEYQITLTDS